MTRSLLLALLLPLALLRPPLRTSWPVLVGRATFYGEPSHLFAGNYTKGGDLFDPERMAFAVDASLWEQYPETFANKDFWLCSYGRCVKARCWDTGYLTEQGVAVDMTPSLFQRFAPLGEGVIQMRVYPAR